LGEWLKPAVC